MANRYINKVVLGQEVLLDISSDNVSDADVLSGKTFHKGNGESSVGTCTYDADTSDATATASRIYKGMTAYVNGDKITGTAEATVTGTTLVIPEGLITI